MLRTQQRGDTLIEVLFAFSILSLVVVGAMSLMNQGTAASQRALETTLVRQQIDAQATTLRFLHDAYVAQYQPGATYDIDTPAGQWAEMTATMPITSASDLNDCPSPRPNGSFITDPVTATYIPQSQDVLQDAETFAQLRYDQTSGVLASAEGLWIEGIRSQATGAANQDNTRFIDFHVYACWDSPGQGPPITLGTIVRLYEPRD
jgi:type II secretory pathway pseudopilin PulG